MADMLVLSKTDRATREDVARLRARLSELNPGALVVPSNGVTADILLRLGPFDADGKIGDVRTWLAAEGHGDAAAGHVHHSHDVNRHDARIRSFCLTFDAPLRWQGIGTCLEMLITTRGDSLLRVKGVLNLAGQDRPVVIHGVQHIFADPVCLMPGPATTRGRAGSSLSRATWNDSWSKQACEPSNQPPRLSQCR